MPRTYKVRLKDAEDIVEDYYQKLSADKKFSTSHFEHDLRHRWQKHESVTALGFKEFILKLHEDDRYKNVALYFMANSTNTPPDEYKAHAEKAFANKPDQPLKYGSEEYATAAENYWKNLVLSTEADTK
jgi:phosphoenolpyruvate carboxylase